MSNQHLFVYGTLLDDTTREKVIGRKVSGTPDTLHDFSKQSIEVNGEQYPCAEVSKGSTIKGLMLEISEEEIGKIDSYETGNYDRKQVELDSGASAWVYALPQSAPQNT